MDHCNELMLQNVANESVLGLAATITLLRVVKALTGITESLYVTGRRCVTLHYSDGLWALREWHQT